jgi:NAD(P)H-nitrite reductase large subunit
VHVHYLMRGGRYWRSVLDEDESRMVEERLAREGVAIHRRTEVARILGKRDWLGHEKVSGVETTDGQQIRCQMVGVAIGVRPHLELVAGTGIETDRGILVDEHMETSIPGIYAAGDVAQAYDSLTGRAQLDVLWSVAIAQGRLAGANMAGQATTYERGIPFNVTRLTGLVVSLIGAVGTRDEPDADLVSISRGDSEVWRGISNTITVHEEHDTNNQRLIISDNRLVGAILIGDQSSFFTAYRLIQERVDISAYLPALRSPHTDLLHVLAQASEATR